MLALISVRSAYDATSLMMSAGSAFRSAFSLGCSRRVLAGTRNSVPESSLMLLNSLFWICHSILPLASRTVLSRRSHLPLRPSRTIFWV